MAKNLCHNPLCHLYNTDDRLKKGKYQTRIAYNDYYHNYFCTLKCLNDFLELNIERIIEFVGRVTTPSIRGQEQPSIYSIKQAINPQECWKVTNQQVLNHIRNN